ncbi:unnamed protein product [Merluccius merluccius]
MEGEALNGASSAEDKDGREPMLSDLAGIMRSFAGQQEAREAKLREEANRQEYQTDTVWQRFRSLHVEPEESPKELYVRLKVLYVKWIQPQVPICCVHGDEKPYPTADIYLEIEGQAIRCLPALELLWGVSIHCLPALELFRGVSIHRLPALELL